MLTERRKRNGNFSVAEVYSAIWQDGCMSKQSIQRKKFKHKNMNHTTKASLTNALFLTNRLNVRAIKCGKNHKWLGVNG